MLKGLSKKHFSVFWKKYRVLLLFGLCLIIGLLLALADLFGPMIAEADAYSRVNIAFRTKFKCLFTHQLAGTWLSLHFFLLKTMLLLFPGSRLGLRLLTLILSLGSIGSVYFYTYNFKKNENIALIAAFLFSIYPLRVALSTQTLSEPVFLFFFITSLAFLTREKLKLLQTLAFLFFINIAHGIRYESWLALPLIWTIIIFKPSLSLSKKIILLSGSIFFPVYWVIGNYIYSNQFLQFFRIKYNMAQKYNKPEYFNWNLTFKQWRDKLLSVLPLSVMLLPLFDLFSFKKSKINLKQTFFYLFPLYLFLTLILQVYFGTMEWTPLRYLLIPIAFYLPLIASGVHELIILIKRRLQTSDSPAIKTLLITSSIFVLSASALSYTYLFRYTHTQTHDASFLGKQGQSVTVENSQLYSDFTQLINKCHQLCPKDVIFVTSKNSNYLDQAFFYFAEKLEKVIVKEENIGSEISSGQTLIWEKNQDEPISFLQDYRILYQNQHFYILKKP
jgi:hypothetical protein